MGALTDWWSAVKRDQMNGYVSPDGKYPDIACNSVWSLAAIDIIPVIYSSCQNTSDINVKVYLTERRDIYGNQKTELFASFRVTRELNKKINWGGAVNYFDLPNIFPDFSFTAYTNDYFDKRVIRSLNDQSF